MFRLHGRAAIVLRAAFNLGFTLGLLISWTNSVHAASPLSAPESLLPTNTVAAISTPDLPTLRQEASKMPLVRLWNDPAMAAFTARVSQKWDRDFAAPAAKAIGTSWANLLGYCQGQVSIALTADSSRAGSGGIILLIDAGNRAAQLDSLFQDIQKAWTNAGNSIRGETISSNGFLALSFPQSAVPGPIQEFFPRLPKSAAIGTNIIAPTAEFFLGRISSWLVAGTRKTDIAQVCAALNGNRGIPSFTERLGANQPVVLPQAALYGWIDAPALLGVVARNYPLPLPGATRAIDDITPEMLIQATGLDKIRTVFFSARMLPDGLLYQMTCAVPESERLGLVRLLAAEPKNCAPPPFVPAETVEFDRWRVNGRTAWATLQQVFTSISPHWTNSAALILDTANAAARLKDPTFDINTNLFGNLGDDLIIMERPPRDLSPEALASPPTIYLLGSPNPPQLASALGSIFIFLDREAEKPKEREVAGQTVRSVPLPAVTLGANIAFTNPLARRLHYAPTRGYVALSTDAAFLEQFLQTTNPPTSNLLAHADFPGALRQVVDSGTGLFGFNHRLALWRTRWPVRQATTNAVATTQTGFTHGFLPGLPGVALPANAADWFDLKLLPPVESVDKYFHYTVYGGTASTNGITWKMFEPTPPGFK